MDGWMGGWMDGWVGEWLDGWMDGWVGGWLGGRMDGWVGGWLDGWVAGWLDGWMHACVYVCIYTRRHVAGLWRRSTTRSPDTTIRKFSCLANISTKLHDNHDIKTMLFHGLVMGQTLETQVTRSCSCKNIMDRVLVGFGLLWPACNCELSHYETSTSLKDSRCPVVPLPNFLWRLHICKIASRSNSSWHGQLQRMSVGGFHCNHPKSRRADRSQSRLATSLMTSRIYQLRYMNRIIYLPLESHAAIPAKLAND